MKVGEGSIPHAAYAALPVFTIVRKPTSRRVGNLFGIIKRRIGQEGPNGFELSGERNRAKRGARVRCSEMLGATVVSERIAVREKEEGCNGTSERTKEKKDLMALLDANQHI